jgi:hypothetical protein
LPGDSAPDHFHKHNHGIISFSSSYFCLLLWAWVLLDKLFEWQIGTRHLKKINNLVSECVEFIQFD